MPPSLNPTIPFSLSQISPITMPSSSEYPLVSAICLHSGRSAGCSGCVTHLSDLCLSDILGRHGPSVDDGRALRQVCLRIRFHCRPRWRTRNDASLHDVHVRPSWNHLHSTRLQAFIQTNLGPERGSRRYVSPLIIVGCSYGLTFCFDRISLGCRDVRRDGGRTFSECT